MPLKRNQAHRIKPSSSMTAVLIRRETQRYVCRGKVMGGRSEKMTFYKLRR